MKRSRKFIIILVSVLSSCILVAFGIIFLFKKQVAPPVYEMEKAREIIFQAWSSGADQNTFELLKQSENYYDSAMLCWQYENKKIFFTRDYNLIRKYARLSAEYADKARNRTIAQNSGQKVKLREKLDNLKNEIDDFNSVYNRIPLPQSVSKEYSKGNLFYTEAEQYFTEGKNILCEKKIVDAGISIYNAYRKTIDSSITKESSVIIIDKFSRDLYIYLNGILIKRYKVELGPNWIGDKRQEGDMATPEGFYIVKEKLDCRKTKFYKALLINYPNEEDLENFNQDKQNGTLHPSARIGGAIEIHGAGGIDRDWTDGCVALRNSDMDTVFAYSSPGTMVTIVGSLKPLDRILKVRSID
jgi:hypothetical protein